MPAIHIKPRETEMKIIAIKSVSGKHKIIFWKQIIVILIVDLILESFALLLILSYFKIRSFMSQKNAEDIPVIKERISLKTSVSCFID